MGDVCVISRDYPWWTKSRYPSPHVVCGFKVGTISVLICWMPCCCCSSIIYFWQHGETAQRGVRQQGGVRFGGWIQFAGAQSSLLSSDKVRSMVTRGLCNRVHKVLAFGRFWIIAWRLHAKRHTSGGASTTRACWARPDCIRRYT